MTEGTDATAVRYPDTRAGMRHLLALGISPIWLTTDQPHLGWVHLLFDLVQMLTDIGDSQVFLAFRVLNEDGCWGHLYLCTDVPSIGPPTAVRVLDLEHVPGISAPYHGPYCLDVDQLCTYADELLRTGTASTVAEAVTIALDTATRARFINWNALRSDLLNNWLSSGVVDVELAVDTFARLPSGFRSIVEALGGPEDDIHLHDNGEPEDLRYREVLFNFLFACVQAGQE